MEFLGSNVSMRAWSSKNPINTKISMTNRRTFGGIFGSLKEPSKNVPGFLPKKWFTGPRYFIFSARAKVEEFPGIKRNDTRE